MAVRSAVLKGAASVERVRGVPQRPPLQWPTFSPPYTCLPTGRKATYRGRNAVARNQATSVFGSAPRRSTVANRCLEPMRTDRVLRTSRMSVEQARLGVASPNAYLLRQRAPHEGAHHHGSHVRSRSRLPSPEGAGISAPNKRKAPHPERASAKRSRRRQKQSRRSRARPAGRAPTSRGIFASGTVEPAHRDLARRAPDKAGAAPAAAGHSASCARARATGRACHAHVAAVAAAARAAGAEAC